MPRIKEGFKGERMVVLPAYLIEQLRHDPLGRELYITDIGYYPRADYHYCERSEEAAQEFVLIYCVEGCGWFCIDDERHEVQANQFFILPKYRRHSYGSAEGQPWTIYWIHFDGAKAAFFSVGFSKPHDIMPAAHSRIKERLMLFDEIFAAVSAGLNCNYMLYATTMLFHFLGSMKFLGEYRECRFTTPEMGMGLVERADHFMRENLSKKLTLAEIAGEVKLSASYFSSVFEQRTGLSPLRYLNHLRMQEACRYLQFTDMKINQISPLVGFDDPLYFSRRFTQYMGLTPSEYKASKRGQQLA